MLLAGDLGGTKTNLAIYDPEKGEEFSVELALRQPDVLQVKGYMGMKFLSETFTWHRAPPDQQRCTA